LRQDDRQKWLTPRTPKTLSHRISSLSSFYKYLAGAAAELRLPINVPNPAHAQFIAPKSSDPLEGTRELSATRARQLMGFLAGDGVLDYRDRAILKTYLYTGVRLASACRLRVRDFHQDGDEATRIINEKGNRHRTIGIHFAATEAIAEYVSKAELESGPLFRARRAPRADELGEQPMGDASMYRVVADYLERLPGAVKEGAHLQHPLAARHHRDATPGWRRRHSQSPGTARPPACDHDSDLRRTAPHHPRKCLARRSYLTSGGFKSR